MCEVPICKKRDGKGVEDYRGVTLMPSLYTRWCWRCEGLVRRVEEVIRETKSRVRVEGRVGEGFWIARGVRQGCPLSPLLFNILISNVEEVLGKIKWGGISLGGKKFYTLAYADDMVLMAESEDEMRSLMERMERYLEGKGLEVNAGKTKIMRFRVVEDGIKGRENGRERRSKKLKNLNI